MAKQERIAVVTVVGEDGEIDYVDAEEFDENPPRNVTEVSRETYHTNRD